MNLDLIYEYLIYTEESLSSPEALTTLKNLKNEVRTLMEDIPRLESDSLRRSRRPLQKSTGLSFKARNKVHNVTGSRAPLVEQRGNRYK